MELNPAQEEMLALLGARPEERPAFDRELRDQLREQLETALEPVAARIGDTLFISKHRLSQVHGCEGKMLADEQAPFEWRVQLARGRIVHKAIELAVHWRGEPVPRDLVDEAIARISDDQSNLGDWLVTLSEADRTELRALATDMVTTFCETFPPLQARWRPVTESRMRTELCDGAIILSGQADLTLGSSEGSVAGKVIIDFKTGQYRAEHSQDLRFYALLESLSRGTPPRLLATAYLDQGRPRTEEVTNDVLAAALHRTIDGTARIAELATGERQPELRPGPGCRWCPAADDCEPGQAWLAGTDDEGR